jgi:hypothetical protein
VEMRNKRAEIMIAFRLVFVASLMSTSTFSRISGVGVSSELLSSSPLDEAVRVLFSVVFSF